MERFYCIPIDRTIFWKTSTFKSNQIDIWAIKGVMASSLYFFRKQSEYAVGIFLSSY